MLVIGTLIAATYQIINIGNGKYSIVDPKYILVNHKWELAEIKMMLANGQYSYSKYLIL